MEYTADAFLAQTAPYMIHKIDVCLPGERETMHILGGYVTDEPMNESDEYLFENVKLNRVTGEVWRQMFDLTVSMN